MILLVYIYLTAISLGFASWGYWAKSAPFIFASGVLFIITGMMFVLPIAAGGGINIEDGTHSFYNYTCNYACDAQTGEVVVTDIRVYPKYYTMTGWYPNTLATMYLLLGLYLLYATVFDTRVNQSLET